MRSEIPARSTLGLESSRTRSAFDLLARPQIGRRLALAAHLLLCLGSVGLFASANELPANAVPGLTVRRSMRAAPHRLIVHPSEVTVAANQSQQFAVTDAQGKPVSVHWNVSGIGCSGEACGTIDEHGVYQPPRSLPQPRIVTVEGVLVSDPNYSVLTEVRLADAVASALIETPAQKPQALAAPMIAPEVTRQNLSGSGNFPPLPKAVASAPVVESRSSIVRSGEAPPLPTVISAAPAIGNQNVARSSGRLPVPNAVASAPAVESWQVARTGELPPLPGAVAATPSVEKTSVSSRGDVPQLPKAVSAAPAIEKADAGRRMELPPLPKAIGAAPVADSAARDRTVELQQPTAISASPVVANRNVAQNLELQPITSMLVIVPDTGRKTGARSAPSQNASVQVHESKLSNKPSSIKSTAPELLASARPASTHVYSEKVQSLASTPERIPAASSALLPQMQDSPAAAPTAAAPTHAAPVAQQHASVTYSNGQLTIDAENLTLAAVLKLVAEKTGAVIEVPPGAGTERIFDHIGPGRPEDVLASLLNGSAFDFVIVGSPQGTHEPTQVLLTLRGTEAPAPTPTLVASDQGSNQPKADAYLWTPSSSPAVSPSTVWVPPAVSSAVTTATQSGSAATPPEPLSPDAREQLMRNFTRQLHGLPPQAETPPQQ